MIHDDEIAEKKFAKIPFVVSTTSSGHVLDESLWDVTKETRTLTNRNLDYLRTTISACQRLSSTEDANYPSSQQRLR